MFDAHNHFHFEEFDDDRDAALERAADAGVTGMVLAGYDAERRELAARLAERDGIWASAGLHPWAVRDKTSEEVDAELAALENLDWSPFAALGELGLDWYIARDDESRRPQIEAFRRQLAVARDHDLPIVVHCVRANADVADWFERDGLPGRGAMIHSFWGSTDDAQRFVDLGCHLSIGTQLTKSQPEKMMQALNTVGLERLFVETDAPSRPPAQVDAERNEPAYLPCVVDSLALVLGTDAAHVARQTEQNTRNWLNLGDERLPVSSE